MLMLTPTVYRDYQGKKGVLEAFDADMDFRVNAPIGEYEKFNGYATNKTDLIDMGITQVKVRFKKLTESVIIKIDAKKGECYESKD